jgi:hypothetical protein
VFLILSRVTRAQLLGHPEWSYSCHSERSEESRIFFDAGRRTPNRDPIANALDWNVCAGAVRLRAP